MEYNTLKISRSEMAALSNSHTYIYIKGILHIGTSKHDTTLKCHNTTTFQQNTIYHMAHESNTKPQTARGSRIYLSLDL
jgi:hypothetical protein